MPDKKLTDSEIKKALECCADLENHDCKTECPYCDKGCDTELLKNTLDLINRQQAENTELLGKIEGLEANRVELLENIEQLESVITQIKSEAYKEFAEKLLDAYEIWTDNDELEYKYVAELVDNLLKEMVGEDK